MLIKEFRNHTVTRILLSEQGSYCMYIGLANQQSYITDTPSNQPHSQNPEKNTPKLAIQNDAQ